MYQMLQDNDSTTDAASLRVAELAVGSAYVFAMTAQYPHLPDIRGPVVTYAGVGDRGTFVMACTASERHDDYWLSIAESFEVLPVE